METQTVDTDAAVPDFDGLYRKYAGAVYNRCYHFTRNREDAEDLVHEVFIKVQKYYGSFRHDSDVYTWIYRIATTTCINFVKRVAKKRNMEFVPEFEMGDNRASADHMDTQLLIKEIFRPFSGQAKKMGFLYFFEGLTQQEIADVLQVSRKTVVRKLGAMRERIRKTLEKGME